jgi:hypothetical protein
MECKCKILITDKNEIKVINQCDTCYEREIKKLKLINKIAKNSFNFIAGVQNKTFEDKTKEFDKQLAEILKELSLRQK